MDSFFLLIFQISQRHMKLAVWMALTLSTVLLYDLRTWLVFISNLIDTHFPKVPAHTGLTAYSIAEKEKEDTESHKIDELYEFFE